MVVLHFIVAPILLSMISRCYSLTSAAVASAAQQFAFIPTTAKRNILQIRWCPFFVHTTKLLPFHGFMATPRMSHSLRLSLSKDDSSSARSRPSFNMPINSVDDSKPNVVESGDATSISLSWSRLGLYNTELVQAVTEGMKLSSPTPVQQLVIPELLKKEPPTGRHHLTFLAATGSGKTLAYALPLVQLLKQNEMFEGFERRPKRPRLIVLAPTRELVLQITDVIKTLSHAIKLSSTAIFGGEEYGLQRRELDRPVDVVVATPGRLLKHWKDHNVFLGSVQHIVLDEMDTMLEQGFASDLRSILYPLLYGKQPDSHQHSSQQIGSVVNVQANAPRVVLTSATMTQAVQKMIGDDKDPSGLVNAKRHFRKVTQEPDGLTTAEVRQQQPMNLVLPRMQVIKTPGLHKSVPRLKQVFVDVGSADKMSLLADILSSGGSGAAVANSRFSSMALTMVFCNTATSCRAVQFSLGEAGIETLAYHGELNSEVRSDNLKSFRQAGKSSESVEPRVLVCTDLAARGLDVPQVDHVVMFDFPLNALDYLHRSGRTARGVFGSEGNSRNSRVTALVTKRDKVLSLAIQEAVEKGQPLDGLSSRKSDYMPGGRLHRRRPTLEDRFSRNLKGRSLKPSGSGKRSIDQQKKR